MKNKPKNIPTYYNSKGTPIYRDTTALPFDDGGNLNNPPKTQYYTYGKSKNKYKKVENQWYISNEGTGFDFVPIKDPTGSRAKELNKNAKIDPNPWVPSNWLESQVNTVLGDAMGAAGRAGEFYKQPDEDDVDNIRHTLSGYKVAKKIADATGNIPYVSNPLGYIGSSLFGAAHEVKTMFSDPRSWGTVLSEAAEDQANNMTGAGMVFNQRSPIKTAKNIARMSRQALLPDGYAGNVFGPNYVDPYELRQRRIFESKPGYSGFRPITMSEKLADGGPLHDRDINYKLLPSTYASALGNMFKEGGQFGEDKGMFDYASSVYASQPENYYANGGYIVRKSNDRKGKTHVVIGPDGTKKYFGDPKMGERSKSKHGKEAFYARHAKNLKNNPYFRAYARATWEMGGQMNSYKDGGKFLTAGGEYHKIYKNADGDIIVNHPAEDKGKWDTINLTDKANATTVAQGVAATKKWHAENPNQYAQGGMIKRADGSYSKRGLWDNIRAAAGSGKKPTKEMLAQEKKIKNSYDNGGLLNKITYLPIKDLPEITVTAKKENNLIGYQGAPFPISIKDIKVPPKSIKPKKEDLLVKELNALRKKLKYYDSQNNGLGPTSISDMTKRADILKDIAELEGKNKDILKNTPQLDKVQSTGNIGLTIGKYLMPTPFQKGINYVLNAADAYDYAKDPNNEANKANVIADALSVLKSPRTNIAPFSIMSDVLNLQQQYDIIKNANNSGEYLLKNNYREGGQFPRPYSLPEDSFKQGGNNLHNSVYASSMAQYPAVYKYGGSFDMPRQQMYMPLDNVERYGGQQQNIYKQGGSVFYATNTPQLEGEGKDLTYPENAYIYAAGGLINNYNTGGAMNFKSKGAYQKWLAYGHASGEFAKTPGNQPVSIGGKTHKVEHGMGGNLYAAGGGIHINPEHKGDFTAKANAAGMSVQAFASKVLAAKEGKYSASTRRQANFAKNAAGWKHELGGPINPIQSHYSIPDTPMSQYGGEGHLAGTMYSYPTALPYAYGGHMYAAGGSFNNPGFQALPVEVQNKIKANSFAEGGTMDQLTEFNAGGTHEENPLGGIPQGMAPDGRLNLVEEGEAKRKPTAEREGNDAFIYSDSITVKKDFAKQFHLPNSYIGKTYAEASKLANRPNSRRENDTIEQADIKRKLDSIADAQEAQKAKEKQEETAQELAANPQLLDALTQQLAANQSVQPMGMPQGEEVNPEEVPAEMLAQMEGAQQGMPIMRMGGNMYRCGGKMYDFGGWTTDNSATMAGAGTGALSGAATGATIGSVIPGLGTAIGAGVGALVGGVAGGLTGRKKDKAEQAAEDAARQQQLAQGTQMQQMQNPAYVTPAAQYALNAASGAGATYPYMAKQGGPLYHQYPQLTDRWKNNAGPMGQPLEVLYANGGNINTFNPSLMPATQTDFTRKLVDGGPGEGGPDEDFDTYLTNLENKYKGLGTTETVENPYVNPFNAEVAFNAEVPLSTEDLITYFSKSDNVLEGQTEEELALDKLTLEELSRKKESGETLTEEEKAEYESALKRLNEQLDAQNLDYSIKVKPFEAAAMALPAAYNIGTGLFGKVQQLKPEDYMIKGELSPYQYNITPELRNIQYSEASAKDAIRNAGLSGGAYASNMQNIYNTAAKLKSEALTKKQNLDAQNYMAAQQANMALQQQNMASKMGIVDWNTKAQNAKRMALQEGLKQAADIGKGFVDMRGQQALVKAVAPDYAETLKLILAKKNKPETSTETE